MQSGKTTEGRKWNGMGVLLSFSPFLFQHFSHFPHLSHLENADHGCRQNNARWLEGRKLTDYRRSIPAEAGAQGEGLKNPWQKPWQRAGRTAARADDESKSRLYLIFLSSSVQPAIAE